MSVNSSATLDRQAAGHRFRREEIAELVVAHGREPCNRKRVPGFGDPVEL
jgi:hypothetical protein